MSLMIQKLLKAAGFFMLLSGQALANVDINLEQSIPLSFAQSSSLRISSMLATDDGQLILLEQKSGVMTKLQAGEQQLVKLSGDKGVFRYPDVSGLARVGPDMFVVSNSGESSIAIINLNGELITRFGEEGRDYGKLSSPAGVAYSINRRIYVADRSNARISVFGADGVFIRVIGKEGLEEKNQLKSPDSVFLDAEENIYVLDKSNGGIVSIFNYDGVLIKRLAKEELVKTLGHAPDLTAMAIDTAGTLYLADNSSGRVYQVDWKNEKKLFAFGSKGEGRAQFREVTALAKMPDGRLAVADSANKKIEIYRFADAPVVEKEQMRLETVLQYLPIDMKCSRAYRIEDGSAYCIERDSGDVIQFDSKGVKVAGLKDIHNVKAVAINGDVVVATDGSFFKVFAKDGTPKYSGSQFSGAGSDAGKLSSAQGMYIEDGRIYIADTGNRRIQIFTTDGIYLDKIDKNKATGKDYFDEPASLVVDRQQNIYVADKGLRQVLVFSKDREYLYSLGADKRFEAIYDIAMDLDNNLYVLCATAENKYGVQVYSGPRKIFSFGAYSEARLGIEEPVNMSIARTNRTIIGIYDREKNRLLNFSYLQVPSQVAGLRLRSSSQKVELDWQPVPVSYIGGYNIFGSVDNQAYRFITQVYDNHVEIDRDKASDVLFYKVDAFSGLGAQSKKSREVKDLFWTGYSLFRQEKFVDAAEVFAGLIAAGDTTADVFAYHGRSMVELGRLEDAVESFGEMAGFKGFEAEALNLKAGVLVKSGKYIEAKGIIDQLIRQGLASESTYEDCARISIKLQDAIGAVTCLESLVTREKQKVETHFLMAEAYLMLGLTEKGLEELDKAVLMADTDAAIRVRIANTLVSIGKHTESIEHFKKAIELDPDEATARLGLAETYVAMKQYDQAKAEAITLAGNEKFSAQANYLLGVIAFATENYADALLSLTKATRLDSTYSRAWLLLADVYKVLKQDHKIREALVSANNTESILFEAAYRLGEYDFKVNDFVAAAESLEKAVAINPGDNDAKMLLAKALYNSSDYHQAFVYANELIIQDPENVDALVLLSVSTGKQGKIGKSIDYMKQAVNKRPNSSEFHSMLAALYIENNLFDQAGAHLDRAILLDKRATRPYVLMGDMLLKRHMFDEAIKAYDKLVAIDPSESNKILLDTAYAEKKRSLEFSRNAPKIVIRELHLNPVFSAAYKKYTDKTVGVVKVDNVSGTDYNNLKLSFSIKGYMDFPSIIEIPVLKANSTTEYELFAAFNNRVLEIDEDTGVQVEVALHYVAGGNNDAVKLVQPMTIYGKNAIVWDDLNMLGAFITPKDDTLRDFVRRVINDNKPDPGSLNKNLVAAMTLFNALSEHGVKYVADPNNPFADIKGSQVDYVQFGRETLKIKSGDCDDLTVLMTAGLENLGIETAVLDVPGHLLMMFNTGLSYDDRDQISLQDDLLVIFEDQVWIPLEVTMIGTSFSEAWTEGANKYQQNVKDNRLKLVRMKDAWKSYLPVTLKPANYSIEIPDRSLVTAHVMREKNILLEKSLDRLVKPYEILASTGRNPDDALMQVAIIYARYGLYIKANEVFDQISERSPTNSAVHNNRGNIYFSRAEYEKAMEAYAYAEQLSANDYGIKVNMAMAYYQQGELAKSREKFNEARVINANVDKEYVALSKLLGL